MRHRVKDKKFNREPNERKALFMGLLRNLTEKGEIVTTQSKAKVLKRLADKVIAKAKDNSLNTRRVLHETFGKRDVVSTLVDRVAPAMQDRVSGFTRVTVLGPRRGDNTVMARISLVNKPEGMGTLKSGKEAPVREAKAKKAPAAQKAAPVKAEKAPKKAAKKVTVKDTK